MSESPTADRRLHADGAVIVKRSQAPRPYYLCRVVNALPVDVYYGEYALIGEEFATREAAEARAEELMVRV